MVEQVFFPRTLGAFREAVQARTRTVGVVEEARIEHCLKRLIGTRAEPYLDFYRDGQMHLGWREANSSAWLRRFVPHWPALLAPISWLLYRRLNSTGTLLGLVALSTVLLETWIAIVFGIALNLATGVLAKLTYVGHAVRLVREADERFDLPDQRLTWLESQGGVSAQAAALGLLVTAAQWSLPFVKPMVLTLAAGF